MGALKMKEYYKLLKPRTGASADEVRKAFRRLAHGVHPDKNREPGATEASKRLGEARRVLLAYLEHVEPQQQPPSPATLIM